MATRDDPLADARERRAFADYEGELAELTAEYGAWLKERGYPQLSADELACEIADKDPRCDYPACKCPRRCLYDRAPDRAWLADFIERWEAMEARRGF